ncbi:MAG: hypothetical protein R3F13_00335 [Prosthecobacter sp.]
MPSILAFHGRPPGDTAPIPRQWAEASDWFVIFTLATLFFLLGAFAVWAWMIWRRTTKPEPHVRLLMEMEEDQKNEGMATSNREQENDAAPWEKPSDWWKNRDD